MDVIRNRTSNENKLNAFYSKLGSNILNNIETETESVILPITLQWLLGSINSHFNIFFCNYVLNSSFNYFVRTFFFAAQGPLAVWSMKRSQSWSYCSKVANSCHIIAAAGSIWGLPMLHREFRSTFNRSFFSFSQSTF